MMRLVECIKYLKALPFFIKDCLLGNCFKLDLGSVKVPIDFLSDLVANVFLTIKLDYFSSMAILFFLGDWCVLSRVFDLVSLLKKE